MINPELQRPQVPKGTKKSVRMNSREKPAETKEQLADEIKALADLNPTAVIKIFDHWPQEVYEHIPDEIRVNRLISECGFGEKSPMCIGCGSIMQKGYGHIVASNIPVIGMTLFCQKCGMVRSYSETMVTPKVVKWTRCLNFDPKGLTWPNYQPLGMQIIPKSVKTKE